MLQKYKNLLNEYEYNYLTSKNSNSDSNTLNINFSYILSKFNNINLSIEVIDDEIMISLYYSSPFDEDYLYQKLELIKNIDDDEKEIIDINSVEIKNNKIYIDNKLIDYKNEEEDSNDDDSNIYYEFNDILFNDNIKFKDILSDFNYFLEDFPFNGKEKFKNNDGSFFYNKTLKNNEKNMVLIINWIKRFITKN